MKASPVKYLIYIRKSTDDKTHQVMSLSAQTLPPRDEADSNSSPDSRLS